MTHQDREQVAEAVLESVLQSPAMRARFSDTELLTQANLIRRDVARRLKTPEQSDPN